MGEVSIRFGKFNDLEDILRIAEDFHTYAELDKWGLGFDRDLLANVIAHYLINTDSCCLLIAENDGQVVGTIAGTLVPWFMDLKQLNASESWWFVKPGHRGSAGTELLAKFEDWARMKGAKVLNVAGFYEKRIAALTRLYKRKGFNPLEMHFCKEL